METLTLKEIAIALGTTCEFDIEINAVCIDTRKITKGCLFICIKGERFDAHQFANEALKLGANAVMISEDIEVNGPFVKVDDTAKAMLDLSGYYRSKFDIPVVALTGSVGKTTTKEFTHLVVNSKYHAIKTQGNLNNEIGLPQMLFQIDNSTEAAVIEMGMNHFGELSKLTAIAKPTIAVIALYYAVGYWNAYITPLLYIKSESIQPIQIFLREILLQGQVDEISPSATAEVNAQVMNELLKYTVVVVASIPMIVIYPFVQRFFVKGIMVGSVKG